jgi:hypothetical protein
MAKTKSTKKRVVRNNQVMEMQPPEQFIGSALQPQPDAPRPKTTLDIPSRLHLLCELSLTLHYRPYTASPVALRIGPEQTRYYVPQGLLQNPQWIAYSNSWGAEIHLPDLDEGTAHVLIHYLHTGAYQTLDDVELSPAQEVLVEFKRAVLAYIAAKQYMLHGLQRLAGQQISCFGAEMSIFDVVEAINKDFSRIPDDATWFHEYMGNKVRKAFEQDYTAFAKDDLFSRIDNVALIRVLAKCMVEVYSNKVSDVLSKKEGTTLEIPKECIVEAEDLPSEEPPEVECVNIDEAPAEDCPADVYTIEEVPVKEAPAQEHFVGEVDPIEHKTDMTFGEIGGTHSSNSNLDGWGSASGVQEPPWSLGTGKAIPTRKDELHFDFAAFLKTSSETGAVLVDDGWGSKSDKKRKKKGKKSSAVLVEETIPEPEPNHIQSEEDPWSVTGGFATGEKKMEESGISPEEASAKPEPEPTPEPVPDTEPGVLKVDDAWAACGTPFSSKKKKGKKGKVEPVTEKAPAPPPPESLPEPEPLVEEPAVDLFAGLSKSQKKKLQMKLKQEDERTETEQQQAATAAATEENPQFEDNIDEVRDDLGSTILIAKKKNAQKVQGSSEVEEPLLAIQEHGAGLAEQNKNDNEQVPITPAAFPGPGSEPEPERNEGNDRGFRSIWDMSKKKKTSKNTSVPVPPPDLTPPIEERNPYDAASTFSTTMATESAQVEENCNAQTNQVDLHFSNGHVSPIVDPEQPIEADSGYCPRRTKHLATGDRWKTCKRCRAFLRGIVVEFVRTSSPDETEYEIVDRMLK